MKVLDSIRAQDYEHVEVIVSDDCSKDDSHTVIPKYLETSGLRYRYIWQEKNLGYDANLRAAMQAATGDYLFLLGNDDALADARTLSSLAGQLEAHGRPALAFGNSVPEDADRSNPSKRAPATKDVGSGPDVAARFFRSFTFVSGLIVSGDGFRAFDTDKYDGSIYVQTYLASRLIASGGRLLLIDQLMVLQNINPDGEPDYRHTIWDVFRQKKWSLKLETGGLDELGRTAVEAILPQVIPSRHGHYVATIYRQLLIYPYPYWLWRYRSEGFPGRALNLALGCFPAYLMRNVSSRGLKPFVLLPFWLASTVCGLLVPSFVINRLKAAAYRFAKRL